MSEMSNEAIQAQIESRGLKEGNRIKDSAGAVDGTNASTPLYVDSSSLLQAGGFPFAVPIVAGTTDTSYSNLSISGTSTGSAAISLTYPLVAGAAASLTTTGFIRISITDSGGNLTNGAYYIPFGTLA